MTRLPTKEAGVSAIRDIAAVIDHAVIAVDYDGTLSPITAHPQDSHPAPGAVEALLALASAGASVAIITGRSATSALEAGSFAHIPGLVVEGNYGAQRWHNHHLESPAPPPTLDQLRSQLPQLIEQLTGDRDIWVEDKRLSLVVHTRLSSNTDANLNLLYDPLVELAGTMNLEVHPGKDVLEIRQPGIDKATAVTRLLRDNTSALLYIGDDVGDIPAFHTVHDWRDRTGRPALTVGVVPHSDSPVSGITDIEIADPAAVVALLTELVRQRLTTASIASIADSKCTH